MKYLSWIFIGFFFCCLAGCAVTFDRYPENWAGTIGENPAGCGVVSGVYANACTPDSGVDYEGAICLTHLLAPEWDTANVGVIRVDVAQGDAMTIMGMSGRKVVRTQSLPFDGKTTVCQPDGVVFSRSLRVKTADGAAKRWERVQFFKGRDGSLIVHIKGRNAGRTLFLPYGTGDERWYRFPEVDTANG